MESIVVNGFTVDWAKAQVRCGQLVNNLEAKQLALLKTLYLAQGNIVTHQQLLEQVWPDTVVSPNTIQQTITQLRKTLGDDGKTQAAVRTHPKLGYSLNYQLDEKAQHSPSSAKLNYIAFAVLAVFALVWLLHTPEVEPSYSLSLNQDITVKGEVVKTVTTSADSQQVFYLVEKAESDQLIQRQINSANAKVVANGLSGYGTMSLSPDGETLVLGNTFRRSGHKCITLVAIELSHGKKQNVLPCSEFFFHSPQWLNPAQLVLLRQAKSRDNTLMLLDLKSGTATELKTQSEHVKSYDIQQNTLIYLSSQGVFTLDLSLADNKAKQLQLTTVPQLRNFTQVRWLSADKYILIGEDSWVVDINTGSASPLQLGLSGSKTIADIKVLDETNWLALMSKENWDVNAKAFSAGPAHRLQGNTLWAEYNGRYKPQADNEVSFISQRSDPAQIWLSKGGELQQLSHSPTPVEDHLWVDNSDRFYYLADGRLFSVNEQRSTRLIPLEYQVLRLYQADAKGLLFSAQNQLGDYLIWYNPATQESEILLNQAVNWAQRMGKAHFISNDDTGRLVEYKDGTPQPVAIFQDTILQWRYFWRRDNTGLFALYFQDKAAQIWRYDPFSKDAKVVGHFDETSLFATDISAQHQSFLSDNPAAAQRDLVQVTLNVTP